MGSLQQRSDVPHVPRHHCSMGDGLLHTLLDLCHRLCHDSLPACERLSASQLLLEDDRTPSTAGQPVTRWFAKASVDGPGVHVQQV